MPRDEGTVFVTVGSTLFDDLIRHLDDPQVADALVEQGYSSLVIQLGNGNHLPTSLLPEAEQQAEAEGVMPNGLRVRWFRFAPTLAEHFAGAALVVSHAGSGSAFESLRAGRRLVVVPNPILMDNHQQELAEELAKQGFCFWSTAEGLLDCLRGMDFGTLRPFRAGDPSRLVGAIDKLMSRVI